MPEGARHLDRSDADAAGAALHEQRLVVFQRAALEHIHPDREERFRQAGGLLQRKAPGNRQTLHCGRGDILGVTAAGYQRANFVADLPIIRLRR